MKLTLGESAYLTELSKEGVRKYIADGRLKAEKHGNKYIIDSDALEQVLILKRPLSSIKGYTPPEKEVVSQDFPFTSQIPTEQEMEWWKIKTANRVLDLIGVR